MTEAQRDALDIFLVTEDVRDLTRQLRADRLQLRQRNLMALGFTDDEAWRLARASWRPVTDEDIA